MSIITVFVQSPDTHSERRFDPHLTVGQLKGKLEPITGIPASSQIITLHISEDDNGLKPIASLDDDSKPIGYYSVGNHQLLRVRDSNPNSGSMVGQFTDVSQVEKFEMSDKEYEARRDTVLSYKKQHQMGRFAPPTEQEKPVKVPDLHIPIGSRCEIDFGDSTMKKRGAVRYVGPTKFGGGTGVWIGVEYDEPLGKNDGSVQGERYFTCKQNYGAFVRPDKVRVGDYPPVDPFAEEEEF